jgi:hypothetical protein
MKILAIRKLAAGEVRAGDYLIDKSLQHGFGHVQISARRTEGDGSPRVTLAVGKRAIDHAPSTEVEVADAIVDEKGYWTRDDRGDRVAFVQPKPLYEG